MDWDEPRPKPAAAITMGEDLKRWSVGELELRVSALRTEIERTEQEIAAKKTHAAAAGAIFKRN